MGFSKKKKTGVKKKTRKKSSLEKKKELAWKKTSIVVRRRYSDKLGFCQCVTCGDVKHWKEMQAGHFVPGRTDSILFEETNIHVQCYSCNVCRSGSLIEYYQFMLMTYGQEEILRLQQLKHEPKKLTEDELDQIIQDCDEAMAILDQRDQGLI